VNQELARFVRQRAGGRCEYCRLPSSVYPLPFHVDHIVARQHGGETIGDNLALACLHCNRHKGPNIAGRDEVTGEIVRLFDPRHDRWTDHFRWEGSELVGKTVVGHVTIRVLAMNAPDFQVVRATLMIEGVFPFD
jgi:hypothetical protein